MLFYLYTIISHTIFIFILFMIKLYPNEMLNYYHIILDNYSKLTYISYLIDEPFLLIALDYLYEDR
jgi:hypothetical protein